MPAISNNLRNYIELVEERNIGHGRAAVYWNHIHQYANISLIILTSVATVLSVMHDSIPSYVVPIITGLATTISSFIGVFKPYEKREEQLTSARKFKKLMLDLISSESIEEFKRVRSEIQEAMLDEPFTCSTKRAKNQNEQKKKEKNKKRDQLWNLSTKLKIEVYEDEQKWIHFKEEAKKKSKHESNSNGSRSSISSSENGISNTQTRSATPKDHKDGVVEQIIVPQEDNPLGVSKRMFSQSSGTLSEEEEMIHDLDEPFRVRRSIDTTDGPRRPVSKHSGSTSDNQELNHIDNLQAIPLSLPSKHQQNANTISIQIEEEIEDEDLTTETERLLPIELQERKTINYTTIDQVNDLDSESPKDNVVIKISDNNNCHRREP